MMLLIGLACAVAGFLIGLRVGMSPKVEMLLWPLR